MVLLKDLEVKDKVAIYPFEGIPYEETSNEIIVDEEDIKKFFLKLSRNPRGHGLQQILNQLKSENFYRFAIIHWLYLFF